MTCFTCVKSPRVASGGGGGGVGCLLGCLCWKESLSNEEGSVRRRRRRRRSKGIGFLHKSNGESYREEKGRCCFGKCGLSCLRCFHCKKSSEEEEESRKRGKCSCLFFRKWKEEDSASSVKKQKCWKSCFCCNKSLSSEEEERAKRSGKCGMGCFFSCCKKSPKTEEEQSRKRGKCGRGCFFCCGKSPKADKQGRPRGKSDKTSGLKTPPLLIRTTPQVQLDLEEVSVAGEPLGPAHDNDQEATEISSVSDNPTVRASPANESSRKRGKCGMGCFFSCCKKSPKTEEEQSRKRGKCGMGCFFCCGKSPKADKQGQPRGKSDKTSGLKTPPLLIRTTPQVQLDLEEVSVAGEPLGPAHDNDQEATEISSVSDNPSVRASPADESSRKRGKCGMGCFFCCCNKSPKTDEQGRPRGNGLGNSPLLIRATPQVQHDLQEVSVAGKSLGPAHDKDQGATKISSASDNPIVRASPADESSRNKGKCGMGYFFCCCKKSPNTDENGRSKSKPDKTSGLGNTPLLRTTPGVQHDRQEISVAGNSPRPAHNKNQGATEISSVSDNPTLLAGPADESSRKRGKCGMGCFFCCCKKSLKTEEPSRKRGKCGMCFLCCKKSPKEEEPSWKRGKCEAGCFRCTKSSSEETVRRRRNGWSSCCFCCNKSSTEGGETRGGGGGEKGKCCFHCAKSSKGRGCFSCCNKSSAKGEERRGGGGEEEKAKGCFHCDNFSSCCKSSKEEESRRRGDQKATCCCYQKPMTGSGSSPRRRGCLKIVCCTKSPCKKKIRCSRRLCWKRKEKKQPNHLASLVKSISFKSDSGGRQRSAVEEILRIGNGNIAGRVFTYRQLAAATQNFNPKCLLGTGGFGKVYKGQLEDTKEIVAVKQLDRQGYQGNREFLIEVLMLSLLDHENLVNLLGYCADGDERILVYEFMPLGSLQDHLHDMSPNSKPLDWITRMKIAAGAARGLEYLHDTANPPVIYRDLKASNILLDKDFTPKLSDFGLAKLGPVGEQKHVFTRVMGTYGYCAPEYARTGKLSKTSDVYSFGVLLLEIITGRKPMDKTRQPSEQFLIEWAEPLLHDKKRFLELADPLLEGKFPVKALYQALAIASVCLQENSSTRPVVMDIVTALEFLAGQNSCDREEPEASTPQNLLSPESKIQKSTRESNEEDENEEEVKNDTVITQNRRSTSFGSEVCEQL